MKVSATMRYLRRSTRKTRLVTRAIIGKPVSEATAMLKFMPQGAAKDVAKVLKSAAANAENNHDLSPEDLYIVQATADEGPYLKRFQPRAQGRAFAIHKPMTHVTIVVEDREAR
ncbi:MAG: 50S ribosomal protein L22 [Candidatus Limnocylindrales bacterium]